MLVISHRTLDRRGPDRSYIHIPAIYRLPIRHIHKKALFVGSAVDDFHFREPNSLLITRGCRDSGHHHQLNQFLTFLGQFPSLCFFQAVFGRGYILVGKRLEKLLGPPVSLESFSQMICCVHSPLVNDLAKTPFHLPGRGTESCEHD